LLRIGQITMERGVRPWLMNDWIFNLTTLGRENRHCVEILHRFTDQVIAERKVALHNENFDPDVPGSSYRHPS
jgi:cytochrome P450 family 4